MPEDQPTIYVPPDFEGRMPQVQGRCLACGAELALGAEIKDGH